MTCNLLDKERNPGHSSIVTGWNSGKRKWLAHGPLAPKCHFFVREIWKESWVWGQKSAWKDMLIYSQLRGKSPVKRVEQSLWQEFSRKRRWFSWFRRCQSPVKKRERNPNIVKVKYNLNCFPSTLPKYWEVICI